jgi:hypothetical protein
MLVRVIAAAMPRLARLTLLIVGLLFASVPTLLARGADVAIVDAEAVFSSPIEAPKPGEALLLQATFLAGQELDYVLTLSNLSPWPLADIHLLDRYFGPDSEEELFSVWELDRLEPGEAASIVIRYEADEIEGLPVAEACHQLELNWSGGWSSFLMDCTGLGSTSIWYIPLSEEMAVYADLEDPILLPLTLDEPVGPSKLGLHVTRNTSPGIMDFVERAQPAVIVGVGDLGWLADVKEVSPDTITLGRFEEKGQTFTGDPRQRAQQFVVSHAGRYLANPGVDYWLGWNEPVIRYLWQMEWYAAFEAERARLMHDLGLRVAVGNFSTGTPEAEQFPAFMPALAAAKEYGGLFALHEYSAPTMLHGVGTAIPGHEADPRFGALTLRYRYWYEHYLGPANLVVPLVITEAGIDGGVLQHQDPSLGGWRDFDGILAANLTVQNLNSFMAEISWYDDELRCDPYVLGFAIFNVGDLNGEWASWDITDELDAFCDLVHSKD